MERRARIEPPIRPEPLTEKQRIRPQIDWAALRLPASNEREYVKRFDEELLKTWIGYARRRASATETATLCEIIAAELREYVAKANGNSR